MKCEIAAGTQGEAPGDLFNPYGVIGVAIDENTGSIYVAEGYGLNRVSVFSATGDFLETFTHKTMSSPWGIALYRDNVYVTDSFTHMLYHLKIEQKIRHVATFGSIGYSNKKLNNYIPRGITVSKDGDVFIVDCNNNRIRILDPIKGNT